MKFRYDFTGLIKNYFGITDNPEYKWFCSRFVADILKHCEIKDIKGKVERDGVYYILMEEA